MRDHENTGAHAVTVSPLARSVESRTTLGEDPGDLGHGAVGRQGPRLLDGLVPSWVVLRLVLGAWTGHERRQLTSVSDSAEASALAAHRAGEALESLRPSPRR